MSDKETGEIQLPGRGVVAVRGPDARAWLDNLITNDMDLLDRQPALLAGLLTPQGKILFEFFVIRAQGGFYLDTLATEAAALAKRLSLYKLRAKVDIGVEPHDVIVTIDRVPADGVPDPRHPGLGGRAVRAPATTTNATRDATVYHARRIALGIPEAPSDYVLGDTFPHEANWDVMRGVSFTKGCYVGQEVVSRMQNKTVVRKRIVRISATTPLTAGADITSGAAVIGKVGTVSGKDALAMLRLDRAAETAGQGIMSNGIAITVDASALDAYRQSVANRPVIDL